MLNVTFGDKTVSCGGMSRIAFVMLFFDIAALCIAMGVSVGLRLLFGGDFSLFFYVQHAPVVLFFVSVYFLLGLYPGILLPPHEELKKVFLGTSLVFGMLLSVTYFTRTGFEFSRLAVLGGWLFSLIFVPYLRSVARKRLACRSWWGAPVILFGDAKQADYFEKYLQSHPEAGLRTRLVVAVDTSDEAAFAAAVHELNSKAEENQGALVMCLPGAQPMRYAEVLASIGGYYRRVLMLPPDGFSSLGLSVQDLGGNLFLQAETKLLDPARQRMKRCIDLCAIALSLPLLLPVFAVIIFLIRRDGGNAFYTQERIGKDGKAIRIWKFRSMIMDADKKLKEYLQDNPDMAKEWEETQKLTDDPRITPIGHFLRKTSLDEFPQLWNVCKGEMSLIGPRPIVQDEVSRYKEAFALYKRTVPGMSGLWQVSGRSDTTYTQRISLDTYYIRNWSVWLDVYVLLKTVPAVLNQDGAC